MERWLLLHANGLLAGPAGPALAWLGTRGAVIAYAAGVLAWALARPGLRRWILWAALAAALGDLSVNRIWKPVFERARPCAVMAELETTAPGGARRCTQSFAMPSGHATTTAAVAATFASPPLALLSLGIGAQRVITAQHWPSDVLVGWLYGLGIGFALRRGVRARAQSTQAGTGSSSPSSSART